MDVGIGLPNAVPGTTGEQLLTWARRAEEQGFSSLGAIDRIVYPNYEPLVALAAAAAVTTRIRLCTAVLLAPLRVNAAALAKQALSVNALSGGRLTLGLGLGGREDDFEYSGLDSKGLGVRFDSILEKLEKVWAHEQVGPRLSAPPQLLIAGAVGASFRRTARYGNGWIDGISNPPRFAEMASKVRAEWSASGRDGHPRITALAFFALGEGASTTLDDYIEDYYGSAGDGLVAHMKGAAVTDVAATREHIAGFEEAGCDELIFFPVSSDPAQIDLLADACKVYAS